ncbi:hypothetical protein VNO77_23221 [Canavalia gladiata]|uniref:Uncharacterized protein n=1 Tax=Canavalia gladiata TaxID=3824 RepID=A0AAN9Q8Q6_CANGL
MEARFLWKLKVRIKVLEKAVKKNRIASRWTKAWTQGWLKNIVILDDTIEPVIQDFYTYNLRIRGEVSPPIKHFLLPENGEGFDYDFFPEQMVRFECFLLNLQLKLPPLSEFPRSQAKIPKKKPLFQCQIPSL